MGTEEEEVSAPGPARRRADGGRNDWQTPPELLRLLEREFGEWGLDAAADQNNTVAARYLTGPCTGKADCWCGLCAHWWDVSTGDWVWLNPPYGRGLDRWVAKCIEMQHDSGGRQGSVALLPTAPDTLWWKTAYEAATETRLLYGRVKFINPETGLPDGSNTTGSTIFVFDPYARRPRPCYLWDWRAEL